jgi:hypothetical protein
MLFGYEDEDYGHWIASGRLTGDAWEEYLAQARDPDLYGAD